jgi:hypothetical protein
MCLNNRGVVFECDRVTFEAAQQNLGQAEVVEIRGSVSNMAFELGSAQLSPAATAVNREDHGLN